MARIEASLVVSESVQQVFAFLDRPESHARFIPNMAEFNQTSSGAFGRVGTTIQGLLRIAGQGVHVDYEIVEYEKGRSLFMQGIMGPIRFRDGYILSPCEEGTRIQFLLDLTLAGMAHAFSPFAGWIGRLHAQETLSNLRRELASARR